MLGKHPTRQQMLAFNVILYQVNTLCIAMMLANQCDLAKMREVLGTMCKIHCKALSAIPYQVNTLCITVMFYSVT